MVDAYGAWTTTSHTNAGPPVLGPAVGNVRDRPSSPTRCGLQAMTVAALAPEHRLTRFGNSSRPDCARAPNPQVAASPSKREKTAQES